MFIGGNTMNAPLYIKTDNSLLSSLIKIDDLIDFSIKNGVNVLTITDDSMYGALEFYIKCKKNNIKPVIGLDLEDIVLYAKNFEGYKNLIKLNTIKSKDKLSIVDLKKYSSDLICIVPFEKLVNFDKYSFYEDIYKGYRNLDDKNKIDGKKVYFNKVLYLEEKDSDYLKYLYAIKDGIKVNEVLMDLFDNHLFNYKLYECDENVEIINMCNLEIPFHQDLLPIYECPNEMDCYSYLKQLVKEGLKNKFGDKVNKVYLDRLKYELDIINKMGFCNYFLVVRDYVMFAKENGILVGPGRGSAAGSLVSFCLGITEIDPIKYDLLFERFLNPERISMPDIDIDFEYTRREEVINYCISKYGIKKVAPIITFGTLGSKQVIRDVGKCLEVNSKDIDYLCKLIDARINLLDNYKNNKIKDFVSKDEKLKKLYKISIKLEGLKRHTSIHAAGVVMSYDNLDEIIPLEYHDSFYTTGYSMEYLEDLGLLKMDLLALKNLTLLNNIAKEVNIDLNDIPSDDEKAISIFNKVDTIGIFQFESTGMMNFLSKFKISNFDEIVAALALFRPGPMGNIDTYIKRKNGEEQIDYIHDDLKVILSKTYGIIVYQEQIMQIASKLAGYSLGEADVLRKAMSKKKEDILLKEKDKFISQSIERGYTLEVATKVYDLIFKFASYGFNKAHSVSYAMIAYKMAYLKAHYYDIFMKNLFSMVIGSDVKTKEYINACKDNLEVLKPNINLSEVDYTIYNGKLIYPLTNIKNVGVVAARSIVEERSKGKFKDIFDFFSRCYNKSVNSKVVESLIKAGCFDEFLNQKTIDSNLEVLINYSDLGALLEDSLKPEIILYPEYTTQELLQREFEIFGSYISAHPVSSFKTKFKTIDLKDIEKYFNNEVLIVAYIEKVNKIKTKDNKDMYFITGSDETGICEFVMFPKNYSLVSLGKIYLIKGKVEKRYDKYQVIINKMKEVDE